MRNSFLVGLTFAHVCNEAKMHHVRSLLILAVM